MHPSALNLTKADVTMETMSEQLDKEEAGLTTDRGLEGCVPGLQAFELFITSTFRKKYDKVRTCGGHSANRKTSPPTGIEMGRPLLRYLPKTSNPKNRLTSFFLDVSMFFLHAQTRETPEGAGFLCHLWCNAFRLKKNRRASSELHMDTKVDGRSTQPCLRQHNHA